MDIASYNRHAWDAQVEKQNQWSVPVSAEMIAEARKGNWQVVLTPETPVPSRWFGELPGINLLCLASGGGQQGPILAAAGAIVTVYDNSPRQLDQDRLVAQREGLQINTQLGDMRELSSLEDQSFDLVFNPCSISFIPKVDAMFQEVHRVLKPGGRFLCGFVNPVRYLFDDAALEQGEIDVRHSLPYSDQTSLNAGEQQQLMDDGEPFVFSHSLSELIGGQLNAGLQLLDLYEDRMQGDTISQFFPPYIATLSVRA